MFSSGFLSFFPPRQTYPPLFPSTKIIAYPFERTARPRHPAAPRRPSARRLILKHPPRPRPPRQLFFCTGFYYGARLLRNANSTRIPGWQPLADLDNKMYILLGRRGLGRGGWGARKIVIVSGRAVVMRTEHHSFRSNRVGHLEY